MQVTRRRELKLGRGLAGRKEALVFKKRVHLGSTAQQARAQ
jgi:hypothetical protein